MPTPAAEPSITTEPTKKWSPADSSVHSVDHRFSVLRSEDADGSGEVSWFIMDAEIDDAIVYYLDEAEAREACAALNAGGER